MTTNYQLTVATAIKTDDGRIVSLDPATAVWVDTIHDRPRHRRITFNDPTLEPWTMRVRSSAIIYWPRFKSNLATKGA